MTPTYAAFGTQVHEVLGRTQEEYDAILAEARQRGDGAFVTDDPNYHRHPALGITGHLHGGGRKLHTHEPAITWATNPIFLDDPYLPPGALHA